MKLLYFAWVRQKIGRSQEDIAVPSTVTTVGTLVEYLRKQGPGYDAAFRDLKLIRCAVNQQHSGFDAELTPDDEVAFFPPVTGG